MKACFLFAALLLIVSLSSCGLPRKAALRTRALMGGDISLKVNISPQANHNNPIAVTLLLIYDQQLLKQLQSMPASQWFEKQAQIRQNYPGRSGFEAWEWEWVPGQIVDPQTLPLRASARAGIVFARYFTPGEHRAVFNPAQQLQLDFLEEGFRLQS